MFSQFNCLVFATEEMIFLAWLTTSCACTASDWNVLRHRSLAAF